MQELTQMIKVDSSEHLAAGILLFYLNGALETAQLIGTAEPPYRGWGKTVAIEGPAIRR